MLDKELDKGFIVVIIAVLLIIASGCWIGFGVYYHKIIQLPVTNTTCTYRVDENEFNSQLVACALCSSDSYSSDCATINCHSYWQDGQQVPCYVSQDKYHNYIASLTKFKTQCEIIDRNCSNFTSLSTFTGLISTALLILIIIWIVRYYNHKKRNSVEFV